MPVQYWRNLGMITPFSTDLQNYYCYSTGPVLVTSTGPELNESTGGVLAEYRRRNAKVPAQYWYPLLPVLVIICQLFASYLLAQHWYPGLVPVLHLKFLLWNFVINIFVSKFFFQHFFSKLVHQYLPSTGPKLNDSTGVVLAEYRRSNDEVPAQLWYPLLPVRVIICPLLFAGAALVPSTGTSTALKIFIMKFFYQYFCFEIFFPTFFFKIFFPNCFFQNNFSNIFF